MSVRAVFLGLVTAAAAATTAYAQTSARPAVAPERPFTPPVRVERTLPNGLRVVVARYATVPKVSVVLTVQSGLAVDPAEKAGLAPATVRIKLRDLKVKKKGKSYGWNSQADADAVVKKIKAE